MSSGFTGMTFSPRFNPPSSSASSLAARQMRANEAQQKWARGLTDKLIGQYQTAYNTALAANESRYKDILAGYGQMYDYERQDINTRYGQMANAGQQDLTSRGLAGTTVLPTMRLAYEKNRGDAVARMQNSLNQRRLDFMERRTDAYPNFGMLANLSQGLGYGA